LWRYCRARLSNSRGRHIDSIDLQEIKSWKSGMTSNDTKVMPAFMQIYRLVQKLLQGTHIHGHEQNTSLFYINK
jgi:hypothetical protein